MKATSRPHTAYHRLVRNFDHSDLAALPGYPAVRRRAEAPGAYIWRGHERVTVIGADAEVA